MSWLKNLSSKRAQSSTSSLPQHAQAPGDADDFLSDSLLPVEQVAPHHTTPLNHVLIIHCCCRTGSDRKQTRRQRLLLLRACLWLFA
jgi:hypothetical protein